MSVAARHQLGQWFTPPDVVKLTLSLALRPDMGRRPRLIDPACGDGAFLVEAHARGFEAERLYGIEVDNEAASACRARVPGAMVRTADLFSVEAPDACFDVVVGNPPYVRTERLDAARKRAHRERLSADWPDAPAALLDRIAGRGDLAAACVLRALRLAAPGARIALVVSSALLDAAYAGPLWRMVAREGRVLALVDAPTERWFGDAAVNAVIVVIERSPCSSASASAPAGMVSVARLRVPTRVAARQVRTLQDLAEVADLRQVAVDRPERWSVALRAEDAWFELEHAAGDALVPLGELAELRRGITSGANDIFYVSRSSPCVLEAEVLAPLVRAPGRAATIAVDPDATRDLLIAAPAQLAGLPRAAAYFHSRREAAGRPTLRSRDPWWQLPVKPARLFLTKAYAARFVQRLSPRPAACDQRVYALWPRQGVDLELLAGVLNSSVTALALESLGRASMGEGALELSVADARLLPVIDPRRLHADDLRAALHAMLARPIATVEIEAERRDRQKLDRAATPASLHGLLERVRTALCSSVARRNGRARA